MDLRHRRGALTLETTEARSVFDGDALADLLPDEKNTAKELIEDFMIATNVATAQFLERHGFPSLRRVLRSPERGPHRGAGGRSRRAAARGAERSRAPGVSHAKTEGRSKALRRRVALRRQLLGSGEYAVELPGGQTDGRFGLAVRDYTHSTAPNRRFPDLATQRLLKAAIAGTPSPYASDELVELARHCTLQEDDAAKVERQVRKSAAAQLLAPRLGQRFEAIVTGASPKGTWVRILHPPVEGRVVRGEHGLDVSDDGLGHRGTLVGAL